MENYPYSTVQEAESAGWEIGIAWDNSINNVEEQDGDDPRITHWREVATCTCYLSCRAKWDIYVPHDGEYSENDYIELCSLVPGFNDSDVELSTDKGLIITEADQFLEAAEKVAASIGRRRDDLPEFNEAGLFSY